MNGLLNCDNQLLRETSCFRGVTYKMTSAIAYNSGGCIAVPRLWQILGSKDASLVASYGDSLLIKIVVA